MNEFVEECRREWKRLNVPDQVAGEMAADLEADLREAEAEGASAEEVLGSGAFDPRAFAASWAAERGVAQPAVAAAVAVAAMSPPAPRPRRWLGVLAVLAGSAVVGLFLLIGAALAFGRVHTSRGIVGPVKRPVPFPFPGMRVGPLDVHAAGVHAPIGAIVVLVLLFMIVGAVGLTLTVLLWRPWDKSGHWPRPRRDRDQTPQGHYS